MKETDFNSLILSTYQTLGNINNKNDFYFEMLKFCTKIKDGHTNIWGKLPDESWLTVAVSWINSSLYITDVEKKEYEHLQYKEIIRLNDIPVNELEPGINQYISTDMKNIYRKRYLSPNFITKKNFLNQLNLLDSENKIKITYLNDSDEMDISIPADETYAVPITYNKRNKITSIKKKINFHTILKEKSAMYVQFNQMPRIVDKDYWKNIFTLINSNNLNYLVIDLRNNGGGNSRWNNELLPFLVKKTKPVYVYSG